MNPILLQPLDLAVAASLVLVDIMLSLTMKLRIHRQIAVAAVRMTVQLVAVGYLLRFVFAINHPAVTGTVLVVMVLVAAREVAARPERRLRRGGNIAISIAGVGTATLLTGGFALLTAIRPEPWFDPRYAIPLIGIILGSVLNAGSIALDGMLGGVEAAQPGIEAQLMLGTSFREAIAPVMRSAVRRAMLPVINQMTAAGIITLPGIMTGQILAGLDPVEAVKYQILLMFLLSGGSGLAAVGIARAVCRRLTDDRQRLRLDRLDPA